MNEKKRKRKFLSDLIVRIVFPTLESTAFPKENINSGV
jgi:hypothetical protein